MTSPEASRIRISEPGELIEAIPYLIGFHPADSLVLIGFSSSESDASDIKQVRVSLRVDLPPLDISAHELSVLVQAIARTTVKAVVVVIVTSEGSGDPRLSDRWHCLPGSLTQALDFHGITTLDVLYADDEKWWSLVCQDLACCPPGGTFRAVGCSLSAVRATVAGLVALPNREALAAQLDPLPTELRARLDPEIADAEHRVTQALLGNRLGRTRRSDTAALFQLARSWPVGLEAGLVPGLVQTARHPAPALSAKQIARFGVALSDIVIRDDIWLAIDERSLDAEPLLYELLIRLPVPYDAAALFLFGWAQWRRGKGTLAGIAAERALESDPNYSAATLLLSAVRSGLDPRTTPCLRDQVSA
jgi:hypothetical protein